MATSVLVTGIVVSLIGTSRVSGASGGELRPDIAGGKVTNYERWQGVVGISSSHGFCSGVLVDSEIALSAAHCFRGQNFDLTVDPSSVFVSAGANLGVHLDVWSPVSAITITPEYSWTWGANESFMDLAILRLTDPVTNTETYRISREAEPQVGTVVQIVGYGTSQTDTDDGFIHRDGVAVVLLDKNEERRRNTFAVGKPSHTCWGDSGGPVFSKSDDRWVISGIIQGILPDCATMSWASDLGLHRKWIQSVFREWVGRDAPIGVEIPIATPGPPFIAFFPIVTYP